MESNNGKPALLHLHSHLVEHVAAAASKGAPLMGIQTNDPRITLVAGGYPLFVNGKIAGAIGVVGGTEAQDCAIAEHVVEVFKKLMK